MKFELVKTLTSDNLRLNGLFAEGKTTNSAVLFIHGFEGDFYSHKWIVMLGEAMAEQGISFLTAQHRGTAKQQELITRHGKAHNAGSYFERLEEAYLDIDAWISFLERRGIEEVILAGHSLGTIKVVRYLFEGNKVSVVRKLVLLCPFDKNWLVKHTAQEIAGTSLEELVAIAEHNVKEGKGEQLAPNLFDEVPHSFANYLSWADQSEIGRMFDFHEAKYTFPLLTKIQIPVKIIVGTSDEFFHPSNPQHPEEAMNILLTKIPKSEGRLLQGARHSFKGYEEEMVREVVEFVEE